ncbi:hypothetical protein BJ912DRAFT_934240 [Pholiota molesta]|nr:hypothetical protein BJ912DRAFT_934240 [Pholiota molesta]
MSEILSHQLKSALDHLDTLGISSAQFVAQLLTQDWAWHHASKDLVDHTEEIMGAFIQHEASRKHGLQCAFDSTVQILKQEMCVITHKDSGFHFSAKNTTESKLADFDIQDMASKVQSSAPHIWELLKVLMEADARINYKRDWARKKATAMGTARRTNFKDTALVDEDIDMADTTLLEAEAEDAQYWESFDLEELDLVEPDDDEPEGLVDAHQEQVECLNTIKRTVCMAILMQSTNRSCNMFQSATGIFLHSCGTPESVRELLARMGISISTTTINDAISNLSQEASSETKKLGRTFLACYAYDNLDIDLKHSVPTVEKSPETLLHLTTGTLFPLNHITLEDLNCSDELWKTSPFNHTNTRLPNVPKPTLDDLLTIHQESGEPHPSGLVRRERFNAWKFLSDLINHGPEYFRRFKRILGDPEEVDPIPIQKTPSTPPQNAEALDSFFKQTGVGDPTDNEFAVSVGNLTIPIAGDLLTGQHDRSLQESRAEEDTPWRRLQGLFFVMGLFHLKMACADAIWRLLIHPKDARLDPNSFMEHIGQIRPKETFKIEKKPGFRRMHEVIQHVGIVSRLDIWRIEAMKRSAALTDLEEFAKSRPTFEDLCTMANLMAVNYVASDDLHDPQEKPNQHRDKEYENSLIKQQYFLLYEEISHAMNFGDIGRVETCFLPWMLIFAGCGKHKYATEMRRYLENVHFLYPEGIHPLFQKSHSDEYFVQSDWQERPLSSIGLGR